MYLTSLFSFQASISCLLHLLFPTPTPSRSSPITGTGHGIVSLFPPRRTACVIWALWRRVWPATAAATATGLGMPVVEFDDGDGDDPKTRYANETGKLLKKGYDKVCTMLAPPWEDSWSEITLGTLTLTYRISQYLKNGRPFCMRNYAYSEARPLLFLPLQYMEEVRNAPQDKLSLPEYTERVTCVYRKGEHLPTSSPYGDGCSVSRLASNAITSQASILNHVMGPRVTEEFQHAARLNLNRALNNLIEPIQDQCFQAGKRLMTPCPGASHSFPPHSPHNTRFEI